MEPGMVTRQDEISLAELVTGEQATIKSFQALHAAAGRLTSLGFTPSAQVVMTQNFGRGPLLVTVRGTRVALGRVEARQIFVQRMGK
jgi:ferrous iron transport protein A